MAAQSYGETANDVHGWIAPSRLNAAQVGHVYFSIVRKLLLCEVARHPQPPHVCSDDTVPVHRPGWSPAGL